MEIIKKRITDMERAEYNPRVELMPGDDDGLLRLQRRRRIQHMQQQGLARQFLQHLGGGRLHTRAFAGSHDNNMQVSMRHGVTMKKGAYQAGFTA